MARNKVQFQKGVSLERFYQTVRYRKPMLRCALCLAVAQRVPVCGGGRASVEKPEFLSSIIRWVNTILGNLKNSFRSQPLKTSKQVDLYQ